MSRPFLETRGRVPRPFEDVPDPPVASPGAYQQAKTRLGRIHPPIPAAQRARPPRTTPQNTPNDLRPQGHGCRQAPLGRPQDTPEASQEAFGGRREATTSEAV